MVGKKDVTEHILIVHNFSCIIAWSFEYAMGDTTTPEHDTERTEIRHPKPLHNLVKGNLVVLIVATNFNEIFAFF